MVPPVVTMATFGSFGSVTWILRFEDSVAPAGYVKKNDKRNTMINDGKYLMVFIWISADVIWG